MELSNYTGVIKTLSQLYNDPDFSDLFDRHTEGESKSTRFLIKMEVNRISAPTRRIMDFRHYGEDMVMRYEHAGIVHHLSVDGIKLFKKLLAQHHGHYTLGVHEDVVAFHQAERNKPTHERRVEVVDPLSAFNLDPILYGSYCVRSEERMHYSSEIRMRIGELTLELMTSDVSTSGLRVKVEKHQEFVVGSEVGINFSGLRQEFANYCLREFFGYKLVGIDEEEKFNYLRLLRITAHPEMDVLIAKLIAANKHKYKVNVRYQEENITVKGYEQFFLPRMSGLPLYLSDEQQPYLSHLLLNENNHGVYDYWVNEEAKSQLEACFQTAWMQQALQQDESIETTLYSFYYTQSGRLYFYAASAESLQQSGLKSLFLSFAAKRPNFRVFKLTLHKAALDEEKHLLEVDSYKQQIAPLTLKSLQDIRWVGLIQDISNENILADYKAYEQEGCNFNSLHQYRLPLAQQAAVLAQFKFVQLRKETRFSYKTAVIASNPDQTLKGWSNDFSTEGLQIELEAPLDIELGHRIYLELPSLQKLAKKVTLANLAYKVVGYNKAKTILHLHISGDKEEHVARQFFSLLIRNNREKLKRTPEPKQAPGLISVLRNMYCHHLSTTPLYVHKVNKQFQVDKIAISEQASSLMPLFTKFGHANGPYNLYPLFANEAIKQVFDETLASLKSSYRPWQQVIYIAIANVKSSALEVRKAAVTTCLESDFANEIERKLFVSKALQKGEFYAIQLMLSRTGRPDMEYIAKELNYVSHYAVHRAQKLEDELWSVQGVLDLIDVSAELLFRLGLRRTRIPKPAS